MKMNSFLAIALSIGAAASNGSALAGEPKFEQKVAISATAGGASALALGDPTAGAFMTSFGIWIYIDAIPREHLAFYQMDAHEFLETKTSNEGFEELYQDLTQTETTATREQLAVALLSVL